MSDWATVNNLHWHHTFNWVIEVRARPLPKLNSTAQPLCHPSFWCLGISKISSFPGKVRYILKLTFPATWLASVVPLLPARHAVYQYYRPAKQSRLAPWTQEKCHSIQQSIQNLPSPEMSRSRTSRGHWGHILDFFLRGPRTDTPNLVVSGNDFLFISYHAAEYRGGLIRRFFRIFTNKSASLTLVYVPQELPSFGEYLVYPISHT